MITPRCRVLCLVAAFALLTAESGAQSGAQSAEEKHRQELRKLREEYDSRLRALEERADATEAEQDAKRRGISELGQTTIFDNIFNPAISLSADFALPLSDRRNSVEDLNRFTLRSMELGVVA